MAATNQHIIGQLPGSAYTPRDGSWVNAPTSVETWRLTVEKFKNYDGTTERALPWGSLVMIKLPDNLEVTNPDDRGFFPDRYKHVIPCINSFFQRTALSAVSTEKKNSPAALQRQKTQCDQLRQHMMGILRNVSSTYLRPELDETFFENRKVLQAIMTGVVDHALVPPENEAAMKEAFTPFHLLYAIQGNNHLAQIPWNGLDHDQLHLSMERLIFTVNGVTQSDKYGIPSNYSASLVRGSFFGQLLDAKKQLRDNNFTTAWTALRSANPAQAQLLSGALFVLLGQLMEIHINWVTQSARENLAYPATLKKEGSEECFVVFVDMDFSSHSRITDLYTSWRKNFDNIFNTQNLNNEAIHATNPAYKKAKALPFFLLQKAPSPQPENPSTNKRNPAEMISEQQKRRKQAADLLQDRSNTHEGKKARVPVLEATNPAESVSRIAYFESQRNPPLPVVIVRGATKAICFPFLEKNHPKGCANPACNRAHVDLADPGWNHGCLQDLGNWIRTDRIRNRVKATQAFTNLR